MTTATSEGLWSQLKTRPGRLLWLAGALMLGASLLMTGARSFWPGVVSSRVADLIRRP